LINTNERKKLPDKRTSAYLSPKKLQPNLTSPKILPRLEQPNLNKIILRTLPHKNGFHFYKTIGQYIDVTATSLKDFQSKLKTIDEQSLLFHYPRGDFKKWIQNILKDKKLANQIDINTSNLSSKNIRENLLLIINKRIKELTT
jgi:hypothetical protein